MVVDVGLGNLRSVTKAVEAAAAGLNVSVERSAEPDRVRSADRLVMPGQGEFGSISRRLAGGLGEAIQERLRAGTPYLGICLGLQVLFESSDEAPGEAGLGWFAGRNERLSPAPGVKIPHVGWNQLSLKEPTNALLGRPEWFYFVHSFHAVPTDPEVRLATVVHGPHTVTAAVGRDHVLATQFHPEKSQAAGLALLGRFLRL